MSASINKKIGSGVYLVIDPSMDDSVLLNKLEACLKEELAAVQIWDNIDDWLNKSTLINKICALCQAQDIPVLINNQFRVEKYQLIQSVKAGLYWLY